MTTINILPEKADSYRALAGNKESTGRTAGEALDAIASQLSDEEGGTLVIVQNHKADEFFDAAQQERLTELMQLRQSQTLSPEEGRELESLIEAELDGARRRTMGEVSRQPRELHSILYERLTRLGYAPNRARYITAGSPYGHNRKAMKRWLKEQIERKKKM